MPTENGRISAATPGVTNSVSTDAIVIGCLSMHKTGSTSLSEALRRATSSDVFHSHFIGPRSIDLRSSYIERSSSNINALLTKVADPLMRFFLVTCVRDPIGQMISTYFQYAQNQRRQRAIELPLTFVAFERWSERAFPNDYPTWWFDDNLGEVFSFDFRDHLFDKERRSIRFDSPKLKILCIRYEDAACYKETELGWLLGREPVPIPHLNATSNKKYSESYEIFKKQFVAPKQWADRIYESEIIKLFYSVQDRELFASYWSKER